MISRILIFSLLCLGFFSCNKKESAYIDSSTEYASEAAVSDSLNVSDSEMTSTAATYQDPQRKFVRKADATFETQNALKTTKEIEKKVANYGGFVVASQLERSILKTDEFEKSSDSIEQVRTVSTSCQMRVKIPQKNLGIFLESMEEHLTFLNARSISADDVTTNFDYQKLDKDRIDTTKGQLNQLLSQSGKIGEKENIISKVDEKIQEKNAGIIQAKQLNENVKMSEVTLQINEPTTISTSMIPNTSKIHLKYHSDFFHSIKTSFASGMYYFMEFFYGLVGLVPFALFFGLIYGAYRYFKHKKRKTISEIIP